MNFYAKGARFERQVKKYLEARGWIVVRSAGSHTKVDLMATDGNKIKLIQCKAGKSFNGFKVLQDMVRGLSSFELNGRNPQWTEMCEVWVKKDKKNPMVFRGAEKIVIFFD